MRRGLVGCGIALSMLCIVGGVFWALHNGSAKAGNPNERLYTVQRGTLTVDVTESGAIEPVRTVEIKSRVSGRLAALYVEEGSRVRQGQLLARIDPREVQQQVEQGSAQVESAKANAERARIALEIQAKEARLQLRQAELRVEQLQRELEAQPAPDPRRYPRSGNRLSKRAGEPPPAGAGETSAGTAGGGERGARRGSTPSGSTATL
jgi:multidrug efflux pump subunit AcrA (membrane-fusion protein)